MVRPAGDTIGRSVIPRGHRDGDPQRSRRLASCIERSHRLRRPGRLRRAPADGNDAGLVDRVVHRGADGVHKSLIGVGRKIHHNLCTRSDCCGHLDIQHHLAIGTVRCRRGVLRLLHRNRHNIRSGDTQRLEIRLDVCGAISSTELDDANRLSRRRTALGKLVQLTDLHWRIGNVSTGMGPGEATALGGLGCGSTHLPRNAKVGHRLRAVVQSQHSDHGPDQFHRQHDAPFADTIFPAVDHMLRKRDAKRFLHGRDAARKPQQPPLWARSIGLNNQAILLRKGPNQLDRIRVSSV